MANLEQHYEKFYQTLTLPDGGQIRFTDKEALEAVGAVIRRQEHPLLRLVRQLESTERVPSMIRLIKVLLESRERIQREERITTNE